MVGLRYEVGADWPTYKILFSYAAYADLGRMLSIGDPGYQLLSWMPRPRHGLRARRSRPSRYRSGAEHRLRDAEASMFYASFLADSVDKFVENYIEAEYSSQGAAIRVVMNLVPAAAFFIYQRRLGFGTVERRMWFFHSVAAFILLLLLLVLPSSTAVDRLALYIMPLQIAVLSRLPLILGRRLGVLIVVLYSVAIEFVWLNFATHARYWIPYQVYPLF